jgi:hypothetical protein
MKINFNTQIEDTTAKLLNDYLEELKKTEPKASKAAITDAALLEYIQKRQAAN